MVTGREAGRVAGLAVSLGVGLAIVTGGLSEATAEPADSSASAGSADSPSNDPAERSTKSADGDDTTSGRSNRTESTAEPGSELSESNRSSRRSTVSLSSPEQPADEAPERAEDDSPAVDDDDSARDEPSPAPMQAQAVSAMVASGRRQSQDLADEPATSESPRAERVSATQTSQALTAASTPNAPPAVSASVAAPDPLSGVTQVTVAAIDADPVTFTTTRPSFGRVVGDGAGNFTYTPTTFVRVLARFFPSLSSDRFSVTATDSYGAATAVAVKISIVPINSAPRAGAVTVSMPTGATGVVTGIAKATDPNRDRLSYLASTTTTANGAVTVNSNGTFVYTPNALARHRAAAVGATTADKTDTFTVTVSDTFGAVTGIRVTVAVSPVNSAPTATSEVDDPDPSTAVVSGMVIGADPDGDVLAYRGPTATLKGAVVVRADGTFTYTPSAAARYHAAHAYALPYDRSDSFGVTIEDGHGGVTTVPVSVVIGPGDETLSAPELSTFCGCILMPKDTIFHADLRGLPAMPESDTWIGLLGGNRGATLRAAWAGNEWMGSTGGIPVNVVGAEHPKEDVVFNRGYSTTGPGIDDRPYAIPHRPLVEGMPSVPAWDRHLLVFQEGTCISQELYNVANGVELPSAGILDALGNAAYAAIWGSRWIAEAGAQYDMSSPLYPAIGHSNASRLPYLPMILRPDDLERGYIDHMLGITIAKDVGAGYVWPARAGDGSAADGIPMGTVLRLRGDVDISQYAQSTQIILRALQVHGAVVFDSKGPGTDGASLLAMSNGWEDTDYVTAKSELNTIPINLFEAVDAASLAIDPAAGWLIS